MPITPPPGLVRGRGRFNVRTFRAVSVELNNIQRDIDEIFEEATSGGVSGAAVQDVAALRAVPEADREDKQLRLVEDAPGSAALGAIYRFDSTGAGADDGILILTPDVGSGRWFKVSNVEGGFFTDGAGTNAAIGKGAVPPTAAGTDAFAHGDGSDATGLHSFAQGKNNTAGDYSFAQGGGNTASGYYGFAQGKLNNVSAQYTFAQGGGNTVNANGGFAHGAGNNVSSPACCAQGYSNTISASSNNGFAQGSSNTISAASPDSFAQGSTNTVSGARGFAQGNRAHAKFADVKVWGSNRAVLGKAQSGHVTKHLQTTDATADQVVAAIPITTATAMLLEAAVVGRGPAGDIAWTDRILIRIYRDAVNIILNGAPTFTVTLVGLTTATVNVNANTASQELEIRVTGEGATTIDWVAQVRIIESVT